MTLILDLRIKVTMIQRLSFRFMQRSLNILCVFVLPCFVAECTYKVWWYASGASQIPFLGNAILSNIVACSLELISWIYRTLIFFLVCILFRLICYLQILRLKDFASVFEVDSDVASILVEHLRIRRHLRIISHRYRAFILCALILITLSQLTFLLLTTKPNADVSIFRAGELAVCLSFHNLPKKITHIFTSLRICCSLVRMIMGYIKLAD